MNEPAPTPDDHAHTWQVVLVDPSQRKVVLYSPHLRRLSVRPTPPGSPLLSAHRRRAVQSSSAGASPPRALPRRARAKSASPLGVRRPSPSDHAADTEDEDELDDETEEAFPLLPPPELSLDDDFADGASPRAGRAEADDNDEWVSSLPVAAESASSYFGLLGEAHSLASSPATTRALPPADQGKAREAERLDERQMNEGYFGRFFEEVQLLGKGGQGSVYLVRHVLNGEALGLYACKKIPVGDSTPSLLSILREVHLLESVSHRNIVAYHHAWLETCLVSRSAFAPPVPTLHVLMEFADGGSLQGFVEARRGADLDGGSSAAGEDKDRRRERLRRARTKEGRERAVHLLKVEDVVSLFEGIVNGLAFLHGRNILHLDLKAENVLLHWDDDALLPTCKLSDFGNATGDSYHAERRGGSGTLSYTPPEAFFPSPITNHLPPPDRATDMWALGLMLYLLCFFSLPYQHAEGDDTRALEEEIKRYRGFHPSDPVPHSGTARPSLPPSLLALLRALIHLSPAARPSCEKVERACGAIRAEQARGGWERGGEQGMSLVGVEKRGTMLRRTRTHARGRSEGLLMAAGEGEGEVGDEEDEGEGEDVVQWSLGPATHRPSISPSASSPALNRSTPAPAALPSPERYPLPLPPSHNHDPAQLEQEKAGPIVSFGDENEGQVRLPEVVVPLQTRDTTGLAIAASAALVKF
ncbi:hypothetical protein Rhopal_006278-T1 [Rhodotorula paludigena]|uniref:Protein kinase domain-containing protein n=1 Tax=Rhodotorula paludigena TaxID=86838 RepID=A0AAV5GLK3_9BASI|nr:hypothetical protein Rhopal_006278-T1 [Rhodotorula paludigena]